MKLMTPVVWAFLALITLPGAFAGCFGLANAEQADIPTFGWLEQVRVYPPGILLHAKLDTGADNCSLHAGNIKRYRKNNEHWVSFEISNRYGQRATVKRKIIRTARIKKKKGGSQRRPVISVGLCMGQIYEMIECNLVDRSHFENPVLVGRNFLAGSAHVNSSETFTSTPFCSSTISPQ